MADCRSLITMLASFANEIHAMAEPADVQAHWTRPGVLARIDAALTELGHDPQNLNPEILATVEHLHSGGFATTRDQAKRISITDESRVLDIGCGIGGPARYLAHTYGCRVEGIDLTPELIETARVLKPGGLFTATEYSTGP